MSLEPGKKTLKLHESLLNSVTSSYAVTGTGMRSTLGNSITRWTHPEIGFKENVRGASPAVIVGTQDPSLLNMIMASQTEENRLDGNNLMIAEITAMTLRSTGQEIGKTQDHDILKMSGGIPTITKERGPLKKDQAPQVMEVGIVP